MKVKKNETGIGNKTTTIKGVNKKGLKDLVARYKQKTLVGSLKKLQKTPGESLKKPLKGLTALKSTPAHVKPCDLLKQNLKIQLETTISSSPYTLISRGNNENSPVFTKAESVTNNVVKPHITGKVPNLRFSLKRILIMCFVSVRAVYELCQGE